MPTCRRLLLVLALLVPAACRVIAEGDPTTPPEVWLMYRVGPGSTWIEVPSAGSEITLGTNETLYLYARATDDEGVAIVAINGSGTLKCNKGGGEIDYPVYEYNQENRSTASVGEPTLRTRTLVRTIPMYELCDEGGPAGSSVVYQASALLFNPTITALSPPLSVTVE